MILKRFATILALLMLASAAQASFFFSSSSSKAADFFRAGDKYMERADGLVDANEPEKAAELYEKAISSYEKSLEADSDYSDGVASVRIDYCREAMAKINGEAIEEPPVDDATDVDGEEAAKDDQQDRMSPEELAHEIAEARAHIVRGNLVDASATLIPLLRAEPENRTVRTLIAIVRTRQGRYDEAVVALEDLRGKDDDMSILLALSAAYVGSGRHNDALLCLDSALRISKDDPAPYMNLAWLTFIMSKGDGTALKNAETYYRAAIKRGAARDQALESKIGMTEW